MRETRQSGSEGGEAKCLPYPYHELRCQFQQYPYPV